MFSDKLNIMNRNPIILNQEMLKINKIKNIKIILDYLFTQNIQSIVVEGGSTTISSFIRSDYFDEIHAYTSPKIFHDGIPIYEGDNLREILSSLNL